MLPQQNRKQILSWALYDWANSAFACTVMAGFFPVFFKEYYSLGSSVQNSTFKLGVANSLAGLSVALVAPMLGAMADLSSRKKLFLVLFTLLGALASSSLAFVGQGAWMTAVIVYVIGSVGFTGGTIFYDAFLVHVTTKDKFDYVSGLGYALGYLGGGLLFAVNVAATLHPEWFGIEDAATAVRLSFLSVGAWWLFFSLPIFAFVHETRKPPQPLIPLVRQGIKQLRETISKISHYRPICFFLGAYWLYIDGVDTIIRMAVDYGLSLGFKSDALITALLITQFIGFPAALLCGKLGERFGAKNVLYVCLGVYAGVTVYAYFLSSQIEFYVLASVIGLVQGGVQSLSRSLFARLIPTGQSAEFYGFYNMWGKFATVFGPIVIGVTALLTSSTRLSILSVLFFFIVGGILLALTPVPDEGKSL